MNYGKFLARIFFSLIFIGGGMKFMNLDGATTYYAGPRMAAFGITDPPVQKALVAIATTLELGGGLAMLFQMESIAIPALLAFLIPTTVIIHKDFNDQHEQVQFLKNLALIGTLLYMYSSRPSGKSKAH